MRLRTGAAGSSVVPVTSATGRAAPPKATEVEVRGVEPIPDDERTAGPLDLFRLIFGGANTIATVSADYPATRWLAGIIRYRSDGIRDNSPPVRSGAWLTS